MKGGSVSIRPAPDPTGDWSTVRSRLATWVTRPSLARQLAGGVADVLLRGPARREPAAGDGRGVIVRFVLADRTVVGKRMLRGGLAGRCLGGLYAGHRRALEQLSLSERLRIAGVPTPRILAAGWRRAFLLLTAQALVTEEIPKARNLREWARTGLDGARRREILGTVALLVRALHGAGFLHADLNVTNIVLGEAPGSPRPQIIDLDRGRFFAALTPRQRAANLARLLRSHDKWIDPADRLRAREEVAFLRRYCGDDRPLLRYVHRYVRRRRPLWSLRRALAGRC